MLEDLFQIKILYWQTNPLYLFIQKSSFFRISFFYFLYAPLTFLAQPLRYWRKRLILAYQHSIRVFPSVTALISIQLEEVAMLSYWVFQSISNMIYLYVWKRDLYTHIYNFENNHTLFPFVKLMCRLMQHYHPLHDISTRDESYLGQTNYFLSNRRNPICNDLCKDFETYIE